MKDVQRQKGEKPLILVVDDNPENVKLLVNLLVDEGYNPAGTTSGEKALAFLKTNRPDLVLLDVLLPGKSGYELCREVMSLPENQDLPIIFLSAKTHEDDILEGFESGGVDYITKPFNHMELIARVKTHVELQQARRRLYDLSVTDDLTGLHNRRYFKEVMEKELERASRHGIDLSLAVVDIDHFKKVNDTFGHEAGDRVLKALSDYFRESFRLCDVVGRLGGEEFGVILPETDQNGAFLVTDRFRKTVESRSIELLENGKPITVSIGVTSHNTPGSTIDSLLREADKALYKAKNDGRNRVCLYKN